MSPLWTYFWPCFAAGLLIGLVAGIVGFRRGASRTKRSAALGIGLVAALISAALWSGPLGAADRFAGEVEGDLRRALVYYEMTQVTGHLHHGPLTRRVLLSGPADDFQRSELVRLLNQLPGVASARWSSDGGGLPLVVEGLGVALLGFLFGLLLAYLIELRRRYNAEWNW
jgi:hypothetical protein